MHIERAFLHREETFNTAENRLGWRQSKRAPAVFPENSEIRVRCLTEITFQLPKLQIWLNVSVTACLLLFIQAPTKPRQMKALFFLFQTKRERTKIHKKLSVEGNRRRTSLTSHFMDLLKCITSPPKPLQLSLIFLHNFQIHIFINVMEYGGRALGGGGELETLFTSHSR